MLKKLIAILLALFAAAAFAAVDVNKATQAELETIKGIGPAISGKILDERKKAPFKDWTDMVERVKGVGTGNAAKFSTEGLTVNGSTYSGAAAPAAAPAAKAEPKVAAKAATPAPAPTPAPAAAPAPAPAPAASAAPTKAEKDKAKEEKKAAKAAKTADAKASAPKAADAKASDAKAKK